VQSFPVNSKRSLQLSLVSVETAKLKERTDARIFMGGSIAKTRSVKFGSVA
jgi:hypothetical protein